MIVVEDAFGGLEVEVVLRLDAPRKIDQPLEARRVATRAYAHAVKRAAARASARRRRIIPQGVAGRHPERRVIWLEPGQSLVIKTRRR